MNRIVIWVCAILVLLTAVLGVVLPGINIVQTYTLFDTEDPQLISSAISEWLVDTIISAPFWLAQLVLAIWAMKQLKKTA